MKTSHATRRTSTAVVLALLTCGRGEVPACTLCIGFPEKTATDYLLEGDCVLLARAAEQNPFAYAPQQILRGVYDGSGIDLLVDTGTRRLLSMNPARHVVLVQYEPSSEWRSLGIADAEYLSIMRRIVLLGADWGGEDGARRRWRFFFSLFGHDDPKIHQLAYLEMSRAPYAAVRELGRIAPRESYSSFLDDPKYLEWRSLAILLLSQSNARDDHQLVRQSFRSASRLRMTRNLAPWAAALVEVDGVAGIRLIEDAYLQAPDASDGEIEAVLNALSMHGGAAAPALRDRLIVSYRLILEEHPRFAPRVAGDLLAWQRTDLVEELSACLNQSIRYERGKRATIQRYLRFAASTEGARLVRE